jgi:hypothetical protein
MTQFLDVRYQDVGGGLAGLVNLYQGTSKLDYTGLNLSDLQAAISGRDVLLATHGFNVDRADGIASLSNWEGLLQLPEPAVFAGTPAAFVGILWPGDSAWAHGLDYPDEPKIADHAAKLLAPFIDANFQNAASISFASHSLGARLVLSTINLLNLPVRRLTLMAGAIDDNCLNKEFKAAADKVGSISVLASRKDTVLSKLFPIGNLVAGIIDEGHPWWRAAIGHRGPIKLPPSNMVSPYLIPDTYLYNHGNYLPIDNTQPPASLFPQPVIVPPQGTPPPTTDGWQAAFSAGFVLTRFK